MRTLCPKCGHGFDVRERAPLGSGTQRKMKKMTVNKELLLEVLHDTDEPLTVQEVQKVLFKKGWKRWQRGDGKTPTGGWNYHHVQAELSLLVGNDCVCMLPAKELYDKGFEMYGSDPIPVYWLDEEQRQRYPELIKWPKAIQRFTIRPPEQRGGPPGP